MRFPLALLILTLASQGLTAADNPDGYNWFQLQGGVSWHRSDTPGRVQPAFGLGLGTWVNGHFGLEASVLGTHVDYGHGMAKEAQAFGSMLINPFSASSSFRPFLRLGVGAVTIGGEVSDTGSHTTRIGLVAGAGAQMLMGDKMFFSLEGRLVEAQTVRTRKEAQALAGLGWRWGNHRTAVAAYTPAPAPVETPAPAPAPVVVLAPEPAVVIVPIASATQQYCTILDVQFDIDKDDLQGEDREKLAVLGTFMTKYPDTTAVIEGHTDNVGTEEHNQALSLRRAQSVVTYLNGKLGIGTSRLSAVGYGETRPIADNTTEEGKRRNRRIDAVIACVSDVAGLTVAPARMTMALAIEYDQNQAEIKPEYNAELAKVAAFLKANPAVTATVEGHTGNLQATAALAMKISVKRAQRVVDYLVDHEGIDRSRLTVQGFGDIRRFAYNTSAEGKAENRRVNIIINYPKK
jgi:OOP family OmpA-OmpF porin